MIQLTLIQTLNHFGPGEAKTLNHSQRLLVNVMCAKVLSHRTVALIGESNLWTLLGWADSWLLDRRVLCGQILVIKEILQI
mgnify:CR=1 FL=1